MTKIVSQETRNKISKTLMGHKSWNKGKKMSQQMRDRLRASRIGKTHTKESKEKNRIAHIGRTHTKEVREILSRKVHERLATGWSASKTGWKRIMAEIPELEKQGFRCIPNLNVIPDIIGIKDGKVYAIEVEYQRPNYKKYTEETKKYYDDVIWILRTGFYGT